MMLYWCDKMFRAMMRKMLIQIIVEFMTITTCYANINTANVLLHSSRPDSVEPSAVWHSDPSLHSQTPILTRDYVTSTSLPTNDGDVTGSSESMDFRAVIPHDQDVSSSTVAGTSTMLSSETPQDRSSFIADESITTSQESSSARIIPPSDTVQTLTSSSSPSSQSSGVFSVHTVPSPSLQDYLTATQTSTETVGPSEFAQLSTSVITTQTLNQDMASSELPTQTFIEAMLSSQFSQEIPFPSSSSLSIPELGGTSESQLTSESYHPVGTESSQTDNIYPTSVEISSTRILSKDNSREISGGALLRTYSLQTTNPPLTSGDTQQIQTQTSQSPDSNLLHFRISSRDSLPSLSTQFDQNSIPSSNALQASSDLTFTTANSVYTEYPPTTSDDQRFSVMTTGTFDVTIDIQTSLQMSSEPPIVSSSSSYAPETYSYTIFSIPTTDTTYPTSPSVSFPDTSAFSGSGDSSSILTFHSHSENINFVSTESFQVSPSSEMIVPIFALFSTQCQDCLSSTSLHTSDDKSSLLEWWVVSATSTEEPQTSSDITPSNTVSPIETVSYFISESDVSYPASQFTPALTTSLPETGDFTASQSISGQIETPPLFPSGIVFSTSLSDSHPDLMFSSATTDLYPSSPTEELQTSYLQPVSMDSLTDTHSAYHYVTYSQESLERLQYTTSYYPESAFVTSDYASRYLPISSIKDLSLQRSDAVSDYSLFASEVIRSSIMSDSLYVSIYPSLSSQTTMESSVHAQSHLLATSETSQLLSSLEIAPLSSTPGITTLISSYIMTPLRPTPEPTAAPTIQTPSTSELSVSSTIPTTTSQTAVDSISPSPTSDVSTIMSTAIKDVTTKIPVVSVPADVMISISFEGDCKKAIQPQYADELHLKLIRLILNVTRIHDKARVNIKKMQCEPNEIPVMFQNIDKHQLFSDLNETFSLGSPYRNIVVYSGSDYLILNLTHFQEMPAIAHDKTPLGDFLVADIAVISTASCICFVLITAGIIIFARELYYKKLSERFNFSDSPRMSLKTEHVALTSIPKHNSLYNDVEMCEEHSADEAYCNPFDAEYSTISSETKTAFPTSDTTGHEESSGEKKDAHVDNGVPSDVHAKSKRAPNPPELKSSDTKSQNSSGYGLVIGLLGYTKRKDQQQQQKLLRQKQQQQQQQLEEQQAQQQREEVNNDEDEDDDDDKVHDHYAVPMKIYKKTKEQGSAEKSSAISTVPEESYRPGGGGESPIPPPRHLSKVAKTNSVSDSHEKLLPSNEDSKVKVDESRPRTNADGGVDNPSFDPGQGNVIIQSTESFHF